MDNEHDSSVNNEQGTSDLTAEKVAQIAAEVVNKAISARNKEVEKKFQSYGASIKDELKALLDERFTSAAKSEKSSTSDEAKLEDSPVYKGMQKKLAELEERARLADEREKAANEKAKDVALRQRVNDALVKSGLDANRTRHAMALIVDAEHRVSYDEDGEIVFKDLDGQYVDFETGIKSWSKSDDAKVFMPARGATGSGGSRTQERKRGANSGDSNAVEEVGNSLLKVLGEM